MRCFPALVNCCTIDWFDRWPDEALKAVANRLLSKSEMTDETRNACVVMCAQFFNDVRDLSEKLKNEKGRFNYVTPTSFLEMLSLFLKMHKAKHE